MKEGYQSIYRPPDPGSCADSYIRGVFSGDEVRRPMVREPVVRNKRIDPIRLRERPRRKPR